ncbi:MAG: hypothetical protein DI543_18725 [Bradyrhizobium icense]|nr:MAG: hypothetical protein DI543_18725 [Bradyrhizobium icense]
MQTTMLYLAALGAGISVAVRISACGSWLASLAAGINGSEDEEFPPARGRTESGAGSTNPP